MTSQLHVCLIGLRSGDFDGKGKTLTLKAQSRVCGIRSRSILHQAHAPVMSKRFVYGPANVYHGILIKYKMKTRKENVSYRGSKVKEKQTFKRFIQWCSLFMCDIDFCDF